MTANIAIGMFTPPFGLNLFVAQSVLGIPLETLYRGVLPFAVVQISALLIVTYWPALSFYLPMRFEALELRGAPDAERNRRKPMPLHRQLIAAAALLLDLAIPAAPARRR